MKLKDRTSQHIAKDLCAAVLINAVVLGFMLLIIRPGFESNDDQVLSAFVDGQMSSKDAYMPYINILMGFILKGVFTLLGDSVAWFTLIQYALLFTAFTGLTWIFIKWLCIWQSALISIILLVFVGVSAYTTINYTKTAAVCTVGGLALMLHAMESMEKSQRTVALTVGAVLTLCGAMLRFTEFLPCAALMSVLGLRRILEIFADKSGKDKLHKVLRYILPFVSVLAVSLVLYAVNELAWSREPWSVYHDFDASRVALTDYELPAYEDMPETYDALGINENAVSLFREGNFYEPELFSKDKIDAIITARAETSPPPNLGECLGILLDKCPPSFFQHLHTYALLFMLMLWLACGKHKPVDFFTLMAELGIFCVLYLYLIYRGRYLVIRVDAGLFTALFVTLAWMLDKAKLKREKMLSLCVLALSLLSSFLLCRSSYRIGKHSELEDKSEYKAAVDTILSDREHIYLCKCDPLDKAIYSALEPMPTGYWDRIVLMGGWPTQHPHIISTLAQYDITNPYRDAVDNERAYIIDDNIDATVRLINDYYDADAKAELIEPISSQTGLMIYRIVG